MNPEEIAEKARNSLGDYCSNECRSYCCRKFSLLLDEDQVDLITKNKREELEKKQLLYRIPSGKFILENSNKANCCPSLENNRCTIYKQRPKTCRQFPIFFKNKTVIFSKRCPAVRERKLYPYEAQLAKLGYDIA